MKKIIQWLAKVFNANIIRKEVVYKDRIIYIPLEETTSGNVEVDGNLIVDGIIEASKDIISYKTKSGTV